MNNPKKIVFLYTELATYFISCVKELLATHRAEVYIIRWPLNKEAPFQFNFPDSVHVYNRKELTDQELQKLVTDIAPDLIFCSGWVDKGYLKVCRQWKKKIPVVVGIDNQWNGSFRQRLAAFMSFYFVKPYFNRVWVAGEPQRMFAHQLGFDDQKIQTGFYSADTVFFNRYFEKYKEEKRKDFPKRFIYVGRYLSFKGIYPMWDAFVELQNENPNEWELWCLGTGDEWENRKIHPSIKHFGFIQPGEMEKYIKETGVFILPSIFEPWGVVVHEFASCGFPLLCSDKIGSITVFLENEKNGYSFEGGNKEQIKYAMKKMMAKSNDELYRMALKSSELAQKITPSLWVDKLFSFFEN